MLPGRKQGHISHCCGARASHVIEWAFYGQGTRGECATMWDTLVETHSRAGHGNKARVTIQDMRALSLPVGYVAYGCAVGAYCNAGDFKV